VKARVLAERYGGCRSMRCVQRVRDRLRPTVVIGTFTATAYGPPWCCGNGGGITANGTNLRGSAKIYGIAADPRVLKLGLRVKVWPNPFGYHGTFRVFDTGGAIKGARLDFYDWRGRSTQLAWGRRTVTVTAPR
jgi:3D (Asp-Asp-Asp) domain-containing protein